MEDKSESKKGRLPEDYLWLNNKGVVENCKLCESCNRDCKQTHKVTYISCSYFEKKKK